MALRIAKFETTCHLPVRHRGGADLVDRLARGRLAHDLGDYLGPSLSHQPPIVRIRRLTLRVILPASGLSEEALSLAWKQTFAKALFTALAYPTGSGPVEVFRAESTDSFLTSAIIDLLDGTAATKWQYAEFEEVFRRGSTQAALALLSNWPRHSLAVLIGLAQREFLDRLIARFDDRAIEHLFTLLVDPANPRPETDPPISLADLIAASKLALARPPQRASALRSRAYALGLFVQARRTNQPVPSPRSLFHAFLGVTFLLDRELFWAGGTEAVNAISYGSATPTCLPRNLTAVLESVANETTDLPMQATRLPELHACLTDLRQCLNIPLPSANPPNLHWISTPWCGFFFLAGTLARLGWVRAWQQLPEFQAGGVSCLLAGVALAIAGDFDPGLTSPAAKDLGIALFAGSLGDLDLHHLRNVFQNSPGETRLRVLKAAIPRGVSPDPAGTWATVFDLMADTLLKDFASRIRGFLQTTRSGIVRSFIARNGRVRIESDRLVVVPDPSPFHVALHIAGMDVPIDHATWLSGRRLEFDLGDL